MTAKETAADPAAELKDLQTRHDALEQANREQTETIATLNGIVAEYQQLLADAVMQATTFKTQLRRTAAAQ